MERISLLFRSAMYALRGGFLHSALRHCHSARHRRRCAVVAGGSGARNRRLGSDGSIPIPRGSSSRTGDPEQHCDLDHDCGVDCIRDSADDAHTCVHSVLSAHSRQLCERPHHAMDARGISRHLCILHGCPSCGQVASLSIRPGGHDVWGNGACAGIRGMADLLHLSCFPSNQRQPHRRSNRTRDRIGHRRVHAGSAQAVLASSSVRE